MSAPLKRCRRCHEERPTCEFTADKYRPDGLALYCRACQRADRKKVRPLPDPVSPISSWRMNHGKRVRRLEHYDPDLDSRARYKPVPHGEHWCGACDIEFSCAECLETHIELRHAGAA